jgi:hypothetical protein
MKKTATLALLIGLAYATSAHAVVRHAKPAPAENSDDSSSSSASDINGSDMTGNMGLGAEYLLSPANGPMGAISGSYWVMNRMVIDAYLGGYNGSFYGGSTDSNGNPTTSSNSGFLIGAGARFDLARPVDALHIQAIGRLDYSGGSTTNSVLGNNTTVSTDVIAIFLGAGIEGFIPVWPGVSIELNTGLNILPGGESISAPKFSDNISYFSVGVAGFSGTTLPVNLALHYYFK